MSKKNIDYQYKYERDFDKDTPKLLEYLFNGGKDKKIVNQMIKHGLSLIEQKYDCSDFRIEIFTRILLSYRNIIGEENEQEILQTLKRFPFEDMSCHSMCTWTENHQLILDVSEYLLGNTYPEEKFYKGILGKDLANIAYIHLNDWCDFIYRFGFSEYGSCNYYPETLGALGNIIEFTNDELLRNKFKIILDLLVYDIFSSITPDLSYNKATARAYVDNKINYYNYLKPHITGLLKGEIKVNHEREACFFLMLKAKDKNNHPFYETPKVFLDILNEKEKVLKESNGIDGRDYRKNGLLNYEEKNMRYIMTTGTSGSYIAFRNIGKYLKEQKLWNHSMYIKYKPYRFLFAVGPCLFHLIRGFTKDRLADISYAKGNTYTYFKNNYTVSSLTRYQVGLPSFQQVTHILNLDGLSVFTTSPASKMEQTGSPSYWVGNKINPDCIQHKNVLIAYYKNPKFTHLYFPLEEFDQVDLTHQNKGYIFACYHDINLMIKTNGELSIVDSSNDASIFKEEKISDFKLKKYDFMNSSKNDHYYVFEVDDTLSFKDFINKSLKERFIFEKNRIIYQNVKYTYLKDCYVKEEKIPVSYSRYESDFVLNKKYDYDQNKPLVFISPKHKLTIDFNNFTRIED